MPSIQRIATPRGLWAAALAALLAAVLARSAPAFAQVVVVDAAGGPGADATTFRDALQLAGDGDVLLVRGGTYEGFTLEGRSLVIAVDVGARVAVLGGIEIADLRPEHRVTLRGLAVGGWPEQPGLRIRACEGSVWIEDCELRGGAFSMFFEPVDGARLEDSTGVGFVRCQLVGGSGTDLASHAGLSLSRSEASLYHCEVSGGVGVSASDGFAGGAGAAVEAARLYASDAKFRGGAGGKSGTFLGCGTGGQGGAGLRMSDPSSVARLASCTLEGGVGGAGGLGSCPSGAAGAASDVSGGSLEPSRSRTFGFGASSPAREGELVRLCATTESSTPVWLLYSGRPAPEWFEPLLGPRFPDDPFELAYLGLLARDSTKEYSLPLSELGPGVEALTLYLQPLVFSMQEGLFRLGEPSALLLLDRDV